MRSHIFLLLIGCLSCIQSYGQSRLQDSISLVNLYQNLDGKNWLNNTNWLNGPIDSWYGIELSNNLVSAIHLGSNNLTGSVTSAMLPNHKLNQIEFQNNAITSFPSALTIDTLNLSSNALTFTHLVPYSGQDNFEYSNQNKVGRSQQLFGQQRGDIALNTTVDVGVKQISYAWYKNDVKIEDAKDSSAYFLTCLAQDDSGTYTYKITHPSLPDLTLTSYDLNVNVLDDSPNAGIDDRVCGNSYTLRGKRPKLGVAQWKLVSGSGSIDNINNPNANLSQLSFGANVLEWSVTYANCPIETAQVVIYKDTIAELPLAGKDTVICDTALTLFAAPLLYGQGYWEVVSGNLSLAQVSNPASNAVQIEPGNHILRWNADNGACASFFDEITITRVIPLNNTYAGKDTALCGTELFLNATPVNNVNGTWSILSGNGTLIGPKEENAYVTGLSEGDNLMLWTANNACNNPVTDTVNVLVHNFIRLNPGPDTIMYFTPSSPLVIGSADIAVNGNGEFSYEWSPATFLDEPNSYAGMFNPPSTGVYNFDINVVDEKGCTASGTRQVEVVQVTVIDIPTLFTPNNDGKNDLLILPGIESYPDCEFVLMDQHGQVVHRETGYKNTWYGVATEGHYAGRNLPEGTYFYYLDLNQEKDRVQKGHLVIKR